MVRSFLLMICLLSFSFQGSLFAKPDEEENQKKEKPAPKTADHSKFPELQKQFNTAPEVTEACIGCHTEAPS